MKPLSIFGFIALAIILTAFYGFLMYFNYETFREGGGLFLSFEKKFDENYFNIRKKDGYSTTMCATFPFKYSKVMKLKAMPGMPHFNNKENFNEIANYTVSVMNCHYQGIFNGLIFEIFENLKNSNSQLSINFFSEREFKWPANFHDGIETKVRNIITNVPSKDLLTLNELMQINFYLLKIAINRIMNDQEKREKFISLASASNFANPEAYFLKNLHHVFNTEYLRQLLEALSEELKIMINLYDCNFMSMDNTIPKYTLKPANHVKEITLVSLLRQPVVTYAPLNYLMIPNQYQNTLIPINLLSIIPQD